MNMLATLVEKNRNQMKPDERWGGVGIRQVHRYVGVSPGRGVIQHFCASVGSTRRERVRSPVGNLCSLNYFNEGWESYIRESCASATGWQLQPERTKGVWRFDKEKAIHVKRLCQRNLTPLGWAAFEYDRPGLRAGSSTVVVTLYHLVFWIYFSVMG